MKIQSFKTSELKPYPSNAKKHPKKQVEQVAASIKEFGMNQPIVVDKDSVVIVGHGRLEAAKLLGLEEVPVLQVDLTEEQAKAYRLADNKLNESEWNMELVMEELELMSDKMVELTGFDFDLQSEDSPYTAKIEAPIYEPTGEKPEISELLHKGKFNELVSEVQAANITDEVKDFLITAAARHIAFDYSKVAEYYAHSEPVVQELMEKSALVIIDFKKAIEQGFVELSKKLEQQYLEDYE